MRQTLVSYGGNAYGYQQLIAPKTGVGFGNPAKDVWAYMVSVLVSQVDLHQFEGREQILNTEEVSMRPEKQRSHTAVDFKSSSAVEQSQQLFHFCVLIFNGGEGLCKPQVYHHDTPTWGCHKVFQPNVPV